MTQEIIQRLKAAGMTPNQIESKTAQKTIEAVIDLNLQEQIKYTESRISEIVENAKNDLHEINKLCNEGKQKLDSFIQSYAVKNADMKNMDEKALSAFTLFASLLEISKAKQITRERTLSGPPIINHLTGDMEESNIRYENIREEVNPQIIESLSYIVYAYLGGQARRIYERGDDE